MTGVCQAEWVDDRINAFKENGYKILLISSICSFKNTGIQHIRVPSFTPNGFIFEQDQIKKKGIPFSRRTTLILKLYYYLCKFVSIILNKIYLKSGEGRWGWFFSSFFASFYFIKYFSQIDFIYTTGGPPSAHFSGILLSKLIKVKNITELQDPLTGKDIGRNKFSKIAFNYVENLLIILSTKTIFCTENAMLVAKEKYNSQRLKINFVYPGANSSIEMPSSNNNYNKINFTYLGSLYQTRNFDNLMISIKNISQKNRDFLNLFEINIFGNMDVDIKARIISNGSKYTKIHGLVSRETAISFARNSDILILVQNTDDRSIVTIPFKTYDYLNSGKVIFGIIFKNDELKAMLESHGHVSCQADNIEDIASKLEYVITNHEQISKKIKKSDITPLQAITKMNQILSS